MNIDFAFEALQKLVIFRYGRFEFTACDKWLHKTEEEEDCKKTSSDQTTVQERTRQHQQKLHTRRKCFVVFDKNELSRCKQNKGQGCQSSAFWRNSAFFFFFYFPGFRFLKKSFFAFLKNCRPKKKKKKSQSPTPPLSREFKELWWAGARFICF